MNHLKYLSITTALTSLLTTLPSNVFSSSFSEDPSAPRPAAAASTPWDAPSAAGYNVADLDHLEKGSAGNGRAGTRAYYKDVMENPHSSRQHQAEAGFLLAKLYLFAQDGPMNLQEASQLFLSCIRKPLLPPETRSESCFRLMEIQFISLAPLNPSLVKQYYDHMTSFAPRVNAEQLYIANHLMSESRGLIPALFGALRGKRESVASCEQVHPRIRARTQTQLACMYYSGLDTPVDYGQARTSYEKVIANPYSTLKDKACARFMLGYMHFNGQGGGVDYAKARSLFENVEYALLSQQDRGTVEVYLASTYYRGLGGPVDYGQARTSCAKVIANPHSTLKDKENARFMLAKMHYHGQGGDVDFAQARSLFENFEYGLLSQKARVEVDICLGDMYYHGKGGDVDYKKARPLLLKVMNNTQAHPIDRADARLELAKMFYHGRGGDRNVEEASLLLTSFRNIPNLPERFYQCATEQINAINEKLREQGSDPEGSLLGSKRNSPGEGTSSKKSRQ